MIDDRIYRFWTRVGVWFAYNVLGVERTIRHLKPLAWAVIALCTITTLCTRLLCFAVAAFVAFCLARGCFGAA